MVLNIEKFRMLEERVVETVKGRSPLMEVPYFVCLYHPKDELEILERFSHMVLRLRNKGFSAETISLSEIMVNILTSSGLLSPEIIQKEEEIRDELIPEPLYIDVCRAMNRECRAFDLNPVREDIGLNDTVRGIPLESETVDFVLLDS